MPRVWKLPRGKKRFMNSRWNWRVPEEKTAFLALADGTVSMAIRGRGHGRGQVVLNTGMSGYRKFQRSLRTGAQA